MPPEGFQIGPLPIRFYGIIIMLGAVAAAFLAERLAKRKGLNSEIVWDALIWVLIGGVVGARIWHILTPPPSMQAQGITTEFYLRNPLDAIAIWKGGLGIPGAIIGGVLALYLFARKNKLDFLAWADLAAPALALGQAIGRWGNFFNQELYGAPTNLPWGIYIDPAHRLPGYQQFERYHPLFAYESLWNLANALFLIWLMRTYEDKLRPGDVFLTYLVIYPIGRFFLEFLRLDPSQVAGIDINQYLALAVSILAALGLYLRHRQPPPTEFAASSTTQPSAPAETETPEIDDNEAEELSETKPEASSESE